MSKSIDVVIPCRSGINLELQYALRSIDTNLPHRNLWLINSAPLWYRGNLLQLPQAINKHAATFDALRAAVDNRLISNRFVWSNDDIYVLKPFDPEAAAVYHRGTVRQLIELYESKGYGNSVYANGMRNTLEFLEARGIKDPLSFELHAPVLFEKRRLRKVFQLRDEYGRGSLHNRTLYGNLFHRDDAVFLEDAKAYSSELWREWLHEKGESWLDTLPFLSSEDSVFYAVERFLKRQDWAASRWEQVGG